MTRLRACWTTQAPSGLLVQPAMHLAALELDEEQDVDPPERDGFHGEEVAGDHARRLLADERPPGGTAPTRRGRDPLGSEKIANRGLRDREADLLELADDPPMAPARVLAREAQD